MLMLGIESSCDETSAAVVRDGRTALSCATATQIAEHRLYGGVVPEIASRRHLENVCAVTEKALADAGVALGDIDAVAATYAPGLIGALLAGLSFAKGLCYAAGKPLVPTHHLRGHIAALYLTHPALEPPFVAYVVSGGNSQLVRVDGYTKFTLLGSAVDDAAGEAFDKVARTLSLPYPGGPEISRLAKQGDPKKYKLPTPHTDAPFDVSFSGLKTAVINLVHTASMKGERLDEASLAAAFEEKVVAMLSQRLVEAAKREKLPCALCGGVAVNGALQARCTALCARAGIPLYLPAARYCGDNAAMIAAAGYYEYLDGVRAPLGQNAYAVRPIE
ncbi:MAG: tRNA (adenosine(37)-N6)-threonylcarbamoyltransferase complex transferase subunit TsaD [Oscillospiraceae bacterium]|nr:tRNA (adenosine(37)-N6)-threonylcarbamoyltransferase complex transferase subunit TsaD [Oscillospiraceae bacterium]